MKIEITDSSPCYAPPPEILSELKCDPLKADICSLGIVFFAILTGYLPFDNENMDILYQKIVNWNFAIFGLISLDVADLLSKTIHTNPNKRISIKEIKNHSWWPINSQPLWGRIDDCFLDNHHTNSLEIDNEIVMKLAAYRYDSRLVIFNVKNRVYSKIVCHYQFLRQNLRPTEKNQQK